MKVLMAGHGGPIRKDDEIFIEQLKSRFPDITFEAGGSNEEQLTQVVDAEVYHGWPQREVFLAAKNMKWLHVPGTGIDDGIFGTPELSDSDIIVTNCRGPHAPPMADHVMGMILTIAHRLREQWEDQQNHYWDTNKYNNLLGLNGKTIGILAAGDIGSQIAKRAHGFGMNVYAVDKHPDVVKERNNGNIPEGIDHLWNLNKLDEMLEISDWFVIAAPLTPETLGIIDSRRIGLMKNGAYFILISRGGIADEQAVIEALKSGKLAGAAIDSFVTEPLPTTSPFWDMENVIVSPHASALTPEMWEGRRKIFEENLRRYLTNEPFLYVCDKKAGF